MRTGKRHGLHFSILGTAAAALLGLSMGDEIRAHEGDDADEERCEWALKYDYARIRSHCAEHGLELPHDVPPEDAA